MDPLEVAWAAGIFEGEGCMSLTYSKTVPHAARRVRLQVGMTDRDIIERLHYIWPGVPMVARNSHPNYPGAKMMFMWRVNKCAEVERILHAMLPWLGERRSQRANELLAAIAAMPPAGTSGKTHCKNGHALTPENLAQRERGYRRCQICRRASWRASNEKRRNRAA